MTISINFPQLDAPIELTGPATQLVIEDVKVYSQLIYSLYQRDNGMKSDFPFLIFDENYKELSQLTIVQNPLFFDLNSLSFKKMLFNRIIATLDIDERMKIEESYAELVKYFNNQVFEDLEIEVSISEVYKLEDLFKLLKITVWDNSASIFEKSQLILNVLKEFSVSSLIIFCGLGNLITEDEMKLVIETGTLNQQKLLFLENSAVGNFGSGKSYLLDRDYYLMERENSIN